ncbi:MAG: C39 family peptidase [Streptococcaceae bacterium]|jgi:hypothetical protein|nr:C39 family peptidase [Streptococcaceae bacterium]
MKFTKFLIFAAVSASVIAFSATAKADISMYRLYNPNSGEHFYTAIPFERDQLINSGWRDEGTGWSAPESGASVYRLYNPNAGDHFYTLSTFERDSLINSGWKDEGIGWYSGGTVALYRSYNPNAAAGAHNYTTYTFEQTSLVNQGWRDEGIAWYGTAAGVPSTKPQLPNTSLHATAPFYYSQLDPRWSGNLLNAGTVGIDGCVPTSLAMILAGSYGINTDPGQVAKKMDAISTLAHGCSGKDLLATVPAYGRTIEQVNSADQAKALLGQGVPLIFYVNVGVGHAVAAYGLSADGNDTIVLDPFGQKYYPADRLVNVETLFANLSPDSADWDAGVPIFAIK